MPLDRNQLTLAEAMTALPSVSLWAAVDKPSHRGGAARHYRLEPLRPRYRPNQGDIQILRDSLGPPYIEKHILLYYIHFNDYPHFRPYDLRVALGKNTDRLRYYCILVKKRYPKCQPSQRLLSV